jgi:hypothetical protein
MFLAMMNVSNGYKKIYGEYGISNVELCTDLRTMNLDSRYCAEYNLTDIKSNNIIN